MRTLWDSLPLAARLLLATGLALLCGGVATLHIHALGNAREAAQRLEEKLAQELQFLPTSVADLVVIGDFSALQRYLDGYVKHASIQRIRYRDASQAQVTSQDVTRAPQAPAWFARWLGLTNLSGQVEINIGRRHYGVLEVSLDAQPTISQSWSLLRWQTGILGVALALNMLLLWLVLRPDLRTLRALDTASQAMAGGDYVHRIPVGGSPELRHTAIAFNRMANEVENTIQALAKSEGEVNAILASIGDALIVTDTALRVTFINPVAEFLTGWSQVEAIGRSVSDILRLENALTGEPAEIPVGRVIETGVVVGLANHTVLVARDGRRHHIADSAAPVRDAFGQLVGVVMVFRDVSESYQLRASLESSRRRLALALKGADLGLWDWDVATGAVVYDRRWKSMLGYQEEEIAANMAAWEELIHPDDLPAVKRELKAHLQGENTQYEAEMRMRAKDGQWRWILSRGQVTERAADGRPLRVSGTHLDITERRTAQAEVERLAFFDVLTGLPNRRLLLDRIRQAIAEARRAGRWGALLFIDLDHFKQVNDALGHTAGDRLLVETARRLTALLRSVDSVARLGGDEFVVLLPDLAEQSAAAAQAARNVAEKMRAALGTAVPLEGRTHHQSVSIGIALYPDGNEAGTCENLLRQADTAMYRAKESGRNAVCFFEPAMQTAAEERLALEHDLRHALASKQFHLHLQAQYNAAGHIVGAEVLLRWTHPQRGTVPPSAFIPLAEETGLIVAIGDWVLQETAALSQRLDSAGYCLSLAVNVSPRQFREPDFTSRVSAILAQTGANPNRIVLEITESMLFTNMGESIARMHDLQHLGLRFSLDDFGTGYSSLSYLKRLPLSEVKIDRAFVDGLPHDDSDAAVTQTILLIARQMKLDVVAEGIETEAQMAWLKTQGCGCFQGFLLARPQPVTAFLALLETKSPKNAPDEPGRV